jgi:hypothetical protein
LVNVGSTAFVHASCVCSNFRHKTKDSISSNDLVLLHSDRFQVGISRDARRRLATGDGCLMLDVLSGGHGAARFMDPHSCCAATSVIHLMILHKMMSTLLAQSRKSCGLLTVRVAPRNLLSGRQSCFLLSIEDSVEVLRVLSSSSSSSPSSSSSSDDESSESMTHD